MQIKMTLSFHFTALRWAKNKTQLTGDSGKNVKKKNIPFLRGLQVGKTTLEINLAIPEKVGNGSTSNTGIPQWYIYPKDSPMY